MILGVVTGIHSMELTGSKVIRSPLSLFGNSLQKHNTSLKGLWLVSTMQTLDPQIVVLEI